MTEENPVVLVLDHMPQCCRNCPGNAHGICKLYKCGTKIDDEGKRQNWCPLHKLPEKQVQHCTDTVHHRWAKNGWNACLNEILRDSEV